MSRAALHFILVLLFVPMACTAGELSLGRVTVKSGAMAHDFAVELALTPAQQARGLMFRETMADDAGMLFLFPDRRPRSFWMKNTLIPLDIIFIDVDGRIVRIQANTTPQSLAPIPSDHPAKAVLEINGGLAARLGIREGDVVEHPAFAGSR